MLEVCPAVTDAYGGTNMGLICFQGTEESKGPEPKRARLSRDNDEDIVVMEEEKEIELEEEGMEVDQGDEEEKSQTQEDSNSATRSDEDLLRFIRSAVAGRPLEQTTAKVILQAAAEHYGISLAQVRESMRRRIERTV